MDPKVSELIAREYWQASEVEVLVVHLVRQGSEMLRDGIHLFTPACQQYLRLQVLPDDEQVPDGAYCVECLEFALMVAFSDDVLDALLPKRPKRREDVKLKGDYL